MKHYIRDFEKTLMLRLRERPSFIQAILGPRQVGKTSGVLNVLKSYASKNQYHYAAADEGFADADWFFYQLQLAQQKNSHIIVFDEIQKLANWNDLVKTAWDRQKKDKKLMHWVLLGSSSLKLSQGLGESLAGRFEVIPVHHWSFSESLKISKKMTLNDYLLFGGYPGSYTLIKDQKRFKKYIFESIIESVISNDILRYATVKKPALFRQTFYLACQFPSQEISYNKLLGQLQEAGNVDQIKYYLDLFSQAFLLRIIFKWSDSPKSRTSSPKLLPCASVFASTAIGKNLSSEQVGRVFESIVGNRLCENFQNVYYWHDGKYELDFVIEHNGQIFGIEVKSKTQKSASLSAFRTKVKSAKTCIIEMNNYLDFEKDPVAFILKMSV